MNKGMKWMAVALAFVFGGLIAFNLIKALLMKRFFAHFEPPAVSVSSALVKKTKWRPQIHAVGNFNAIDGVEVSAQSSGNVAKISFESGQYVLKDTPLLTLDDSVDQAILHFNQAELTLKELDYKRQSDLFKRGATPGSSVDEAKANLQKAQANLEKTSAQIAHKHITAPFTGRLGIRQVNLGQYVNSGQTVIVTLQSLDPLFLEFYVPEQHYNQILVNQKINFSVEAFPKLLFEGRINALNAKIDPSTHNVLVQATLPNCPVKAMRDPLHSPLIEVNQQSDQKITHVLCSSERNNLNKIREYAFIPGMFASISINQALEADTLIVPSTAISYSLYGNSVYLIEKNAADPKILNVKRVFVSTGEQEGNNIVVTKGLKEGQLIVSTGDLKLNNGTRVVINNSIQLNDASQNIDLEE